MKLKLLNVLTVGLVALALLTPGFIVFSVVWGNHIELVKAQNLTCEFNKINVNAQSLTPPSNQALASTTSSNHHFFPHLLTLVNQYKILTILQWLFIVTPIGIGVGIIGYDRYLVYRAAVLREQVEMLERMWQHSIEQ
ncbi:hypothetical protein B6N60_01523 [Richelia sinica FACHB-800]|uniref:Uncharacterized protein n=1 Tax=Richelia sinica FACHB-800 TaxID=1357546 RepID=A0A975T644_9NOST|nr:hypothetical protein [Richelia sinica]MBD2663606.1 hypothetical protein [Richelia sinica FACHB-800]QXE22837.1 hypothetical protein B6N60_01523 [Richelia sinica FACHB-800]